jgi:RimJ/RimL family protein N-acetyltransferase
MAKGNKIDLRPLAPADVARIRRWPKYPKEFALLDYALRSGGWLDLYAASPANLRLGAWSGGRLVGFSLLTDITPEAAEFYIALHPAQIGRGVGREVTAQTLEYAFKELGLKRVYLKVRPWHKRGITLYKQLGFVPKGLKTQLIQGKPVRFRVMEVDKSAAAKALLV